MADVQCAVEHLDSPISSLEKLSGADHLTGLLEELPPWPGTSMYVLSPVRDLSTVLEAGADAATIKGTLLPEILSTAVHLTTGGERVAAWAWMAPRYARVACGASEPLG